MWVQGEPRIAILGSPCTSWWSSQQGQLMRLTVRPVYGTLAPAGNFISWWGSQRGQCIEHCPGLGTSSADEAFSQGSTWNLAPLQDLSAVQLAAAGAPLGLGTLQLMGLKATGKHLATCSTNGVIRTSHKVIIYFCEITLWLIASCIMPLIDWSVTESQLEAKITGYALSVMCWWGLRIILLATIRNINISFSTCTGIRLFFKNSYQRSWGGGEGGAEDMHVPRI